MDERALRVLTVGAAGKFAGLVVPELVRRGVTVRGLTNDPKHVEVVQRNGAAEVVVGDLRDVGSLRAALEGVDHVFYISPVFAPHEVQLGRNMIEAANAVGVRRIVFSSVIHPILTALENHAAKGTVEEAILASDLDYVFLHPTLFFQNYAEAWPAVARAGVLAEPYSGDRRMTRVDYRDIAEVAAIALTEDGLLHGSFELCAEGDLNRHDIATMMGNVLGREVRAEAPSFDEWAEKTGVPKGGAVRQGLERMFG